MLYGRIDAAIHRRLHTGISETMASRCDRLKPLTYPCAFYVYELVRNKLDMPYNLQQSRLSHSRTAQPCVIAPCSMSERVVTSCCNTVRVGLERWLGPRFPPLVTG